MFPLEHGEALAAEIPGARLLTLEGAGHGVDRADWETIVAAILEHTAAAESARSVMATSHLTCSYLRRGYTLIVPARHFA